MEPIQAEAATSANRFEKPAPKGALKLVDIDHLDDLVNMLHTEAKVI